MKNKKVSQSMKIEKHREFATFGRFAIFHILNRLWLKNEDDRTYGSDFRAIRNLAIFLLSPQCIFRPHVVRGHTPFSLSNQSISIQRSMLPILGKCSQSLQASAAYPIQKSSPGVHAQC